jgi:hypothetical protein
MATKGIDVTDLAVGGTVVINSTRGLAGLATVEQDVLFNDNTYDIGKSGATRPRDLFASRKVQAPTLVASTLLDLTGGQIAFPATQIPAAGANVFDDCEKLTWTPGISFGGATTGITYSAQTGTYVKLTRGVWGFGKIVLTSKGSATGVMRITVFPFTIATDDGSINFSYTESLTSGGPLQAAGSGTTMVVRIAGSGGSTTFDNTNVQNASQFYFTFQFQV